MRLRNQLLALSLLTLLLPWSGWILVQQLENFTRESEEHALLASARAIARALPDEYQAGLRTTRGSTLPLRQLGAEPILDGYQQDWPATDQGLLFEAPGEVLKLKVLAGRYRSRLYLMLEVTDPGNTPATEFNASTGDPGQRAGIMLYVQGKRSLQAFMISTEAPGVLTVDSQGESGVRVEAAWQNTVDGYRVELILPPGTDRISIGAVAPAYMLPGVYTERYAGTIDGRQQHGTWLELAGRDSAAADWLADVTPDRSRTWLVREEGWVVADSGGPATVRDSELTWVQRMIYQAVADSRMQQRNERPEWPVRFETDAVAAALNGETGRSWSRDPDSAAVYNLVAVPVHDGGVVSGAVVVEASSEGLLLMTNRALGQLLLVALLLVGVLTFALWMFASRLSGRVQKLSGAVSRAMDDTGPSVGLPLTGSADELGDLARNTEKLLRAVAEYTTYLQKLAGRLSHELKTPIAITRSSLENLASHDLDAGAQQYLARAREGLDRQAAIVSAMSEAQRLEGAVKTVEWEQIDLVSMLTEYVQAVRSLHPSRAIDLELDGPACDLRCAPELIAQALDKLVDNAITLTAPDCSIVISLARGKKACRLSVANSGTRLPDVLHEQLFDSLVSLRENRASGQHLGLGLFIVRLVAEAHGGAVRARNLPDDGGVEFTIHLPLDGVESAP